MRQLITTLLRFNCIFVTLTLENTRARKIAPNAQNVDACAQNELCAKKAKKHMKHNGNRKYPWSMRKVRWALAEKCMFVTSVVLKWDAVEGREKSCQARGLSMLEYLHSFVYSHTYAFVFFSRQEGCALPKWVRSCAKKRWTCDMCNRNHHAHKIVI